MKHNVKDLWEAFRSAREQFRALPAPQPPLDEPAARIADVLRSVFSASAYACLLSHGGESAVAVLDAAGAAKADGVQNPQHSWALSDILNIPKAKLVTARIGVHSAEFGELGVAFPQGRKSPEGAADVLAALAETLAMQWALRAAPAQPAFDRPTSVRLCSNELASPVIHEFNNFLNTAVLHMALLESEVPPQLRPDLSNIRKQADAVAGMIREFQRYRDEYRALLTSVDLNPAIREAVRYWQTTALAKRAQAQATPGVPQVRLELADNLPKIQATDHDVHSLVQFLLSPATQAGAGGVVSVQTCSIKPDVELRIVLPDRVIGAEAVNELLVGSTSPYRNAQELELAASKSIVRRLHGKIRAESRPEGTTAILVQLPASP